MFEAVPGGKVSKKSGSKDLHAAEAMRAELDMLCAESFELLRSGMGTELWMNRVLLMEINPVSFPYRGHLSDVYEERRLLSKKSITKLFWNVLTVQKKTHV